MTCACDHPAVKASGLRLRPAPGAPAVLEGADLEVPSGCRAALVGPNGAGKSTLLRALAGLVAADGGILEVNGAPPRAGRADVALLAQRPNLSVGVPCTVTRLAEMGRLGRSAWGFSLGKDDRYRARQALRAVGLEALADRGVATLSGGQLQRALIARALAQGATLLLLDEPYVGLDAASRRALDDLIFGPALEGATVLVSTHDASDLPRFDRILAIGDGRAAVTRACDGRHPHRHA